MGQVELFIGSRAEISRCGLYRYGLWRKWSDGPQVLFIMLNPSTADATQDDPTIRRCVAFAKSWGFGSLAVGNLFAYRTTDPAVLAKFPCPIGELNDEWLSRLRYESQLHIAAWGAHGSLYGRSAHVRWLFNSLGANLQVLAMTKLGEPAHPLYLPGDLRPVELAMRTG